MSKEYIFTIDTNSYAGNFERQMCAYVSGKVGECEVGYEEKCLFREEEGDLTYDRMIEEDVVRQKPDDHGCMRPVVILTTPNDRLSEVIGARREYNSVGILLEFPPTSELVVLFKRRAADFPAHWKTKFMGRDTDIKIQGFRLITEITTIEEESI